MNLLLHEPLNALLVGTLMLTQEKRDGNVAKKPWVSLLINALFLSFGILNFLPQNLAFLSPGSSLLASEKFLDFTVFQTVNKSPKLNFH